METDYLVVGTNGAGFYALEALRKFDPSGIITAVNGESFFPYKRTQVNKLFSPDRLDIRECLLAPEEWYDENRIQLFTGKQAVSINPKEKSLLLSDGIQISWKKLLLTVGAEPFCPREAVFKKGLSLRTFEQAQSINERLYGARKVLVYGMGVEGVETAAQLKSRGLDVVLAGRGDALLTRRFGSFFQKRIAAFLTEQGIELRFGIEPGDLHEQDGLFFIRKPGQNGMEVSGADLFLYSLGIAPRVSLASAAGIEADRGILVDGRMETSVPGIYAAGDCCRVRDKPFCDLWHSAQEQGRIAASAMTGQTGIPEESSHRMKMEPFGRFFFSLLPPDGVKGKQITSVNSSRPGSIERIFHFSEGVLTGAEMEGDRDRAKLYETAVNQGWDRARVEREL